MKGIMKVKKTDIEIKLNNQIPKLNNELNKYHKNISLKFKGKVFLVDDNLNKIKELKNDDKIKKNGYYILKFIDEDNNIYFIKLKLCKYTILLKCYRLRYNNHLYILFYC